MQVTVPDGAAGGQFVAVQTPDGVMMQTVVPAGLKPGDQFILQPAPSQTQMQRDDPDAEAARQIAASMVGKWEKRGSHTPSCFCPLLCMLPMTHTGTFTVHPLDANGNYTYSGDDLVWACPFLGCPCSFLHICPLASLATEGEMSADGTKGVIRNRNADNNNTVNHQLVKIDASALKATYSSSGSGRGGSITGTREVDGRAMTITDKYTHGGGYATIHSTKVS
mmetsp:Transcript_19344/g.39420  ORF Transcript_19344/g.39420 Transcript_19344/m.39420 type:complete len:223 (-) Transcript_19344:66-734(-)